MIQIRLLNVLDDMYYSQLLYTTGTRLPKANQAPGQQYLFNEEMRVEKKDDWQDLLSNVGIQRCHTSFRKIFDHFFPALVTQHQKKGLSREVALELAQEVLIKVWHQASTFSPERGNVSLWIHVISRNVRYDYFRKKRSELSCVSGEDLYSKIDVELVDENDFGVLFDVNVLREKIHLLPKEQQDVITQFYLEGLTHREISQLSNIPLGTVKSRIRLALASMKNLVEEMK